MNEQLKQRAADAIALAEKATPGPWQAFNGHMVRKCVGNLCAPIANIDTPYRHGVGIVKGERESQTNIKLIAAAHDHAQIIRELLAEFQRMEAAQAWQPIETAPTDGSTVYVARHMGGFGWVTGVARYRSAGIVSGWIPYGTGTFGELGLANPTCWMPLPVAPSAEAECGS